MIVLVVCIIMFITYVLCMCLYNAYTGGYKIRVTLPVEPETRDKLKAYLPKEDTYSTGISKMIDRIHDLEHRVDALTIDLAKCRHEKK